ncbi:MAG: phospho-N-acetylmuramoyl-pentapeptide-transferase, partial [Marmoricola sp.]
VLGVTLSFGMIGFYDDYLKVTRQTNAGFAGRTRFAAEWVIAVVACTALASLGKGAIATSLVFPFFKELVINLGWAFALLGAFVIVGAGNAVNLTDGLDGLATGACMLVFGAYTFVNIWQNNQWCERSHVAAVTCYHVRDPLDLAVVSAAITGACFGFLWWNASPAKIFMGDTGSLALGGAVAGLAVLTRTELLLALLGGLFVIQTLSVILQVGFFKLTGGKRLLRMAPLHHHFEMRGWEEVTVVIRFWLIAGIFVAAGLGVFYGEWVAR